MSSGLSVVGESEVTGGSLTAEQLAELEPYEDAIIGAELVDVAPDGLEESHDAGSVAITYEAWQYHKANLTERPEAFAENFRMRLLPAPCPSETKMSPLGATMTSFG